jgi:signal transduction histidine kinase
VSAALERRSGAIVTAVLAALGVAFACHLVLLARISAAGASDVFSLGDPGFWPGYAALGAATFAGAVIARRQPRHPVGWLHLVVAAGLMALLGGSSYGVLGALARPGSLPAARHVAAATQTMFVVPNTAIALVLLLTPTGHFLSPRWRRVGLAGVASGSVWLVAQLIDADVNGPPLEDVANPFALPSLATASLVGQAVGALVSNGTLLVGAVSLFVRFRRGERDERRQLLWLALAALWVPVAALGAAVSAYSGHTNLLSVFGGSLLALLPLSTLPAIQRYRLYGVERLLSRAVTYLLLTMVVLSVYGAVALLVGRALAGLTTGGEIAVGVATFVATVLVSPGRRRIQTAVDRRFNRREFDAIQVVRRHLADAAADERIDEVLAAAVGDPSLTVAYRADEPGMWVTGEGSPVTPTDDALVVRRQNIPVAAIEWAARTTERDTVVAVAAEALAELENEQLRAALARQLVELRESRSRIVAAQLAERRTLEQNLHDGAQQRLVATTLNLRAATLADPDGPLAPAVTEAIAQIRLAVEELREIARGLHPAILVDGGLAASFEDLAHRTPIDVSLTVGDERFAPHVEATAWYVVCEAVANAIKHAHPSTIDLRAVAADDRLTVTIADDGAGGVDPERGLASIRDRVATAGGSLRIDSTPGAGTTITVGLPCGS